MTRIRELQPEILCLERGHFIRLETVMLETVLVRTSVTASCYGVHLLKNPVHAIFSHHQNPQGKLPALDANSVFPFILASIGVHLVLTVALVSNFLHRCSWGRERNGPFRAHLLVCERATKILFHLEAVRVSASAHVYIKAFVQNLLTRI